MADLQAQPSINDLRTKAHLELSARLQSLDLTKILLYTPNVAESALPFLAWQFDVLGPFWALLGATSNTANLVQNSIALHKLAGTPAAIDLVATNVGLTVIAIDEGESTWGGSTYPEDQGWAAFRVTALLANSEGAETGTAADFDSVPDVDFLTDWDTNEYVSGNFTTVTWSAAQQQALVDAINFFKPQRCVLDQMNYQAVGLVDQIAPFTDSVST
jgi:Phage tail protein (Tail_P2_I)